MKISESLSPDIYFTKKKTTQKEDRKPQTKTQPSS